ncbi:MAG: hypothetical protein CML61_12990 [Rhodobacteraceae bacterium]|nr:hypothetical protein [Paracoccaceae bacterium]
MITFEIPGTPYAKKRHRSTRQGRTYNPADNVSFERTVAQIALQHFPEPLEGPVRLTFTAIFAPAQSWSKKKTAAHLHRPHTQKPDLDNIEKALKDGLNRVAFVDDAQVAEVHKKKMWGPRPRTIVMIEPLSVSLVSMRSRGWRRE